jgi:hypothetical protein
MGFECQSGMGFRDQRRAESSDSNVGIIEEAGGERVGKPQRVLIRNAPRNSDDPISLPIQQGRKARLDFLNRSLDLSVGTDSALHYQLFHRTASALLEAKSICASTAFMLVQSFCKCPANWDAYVAFAKEMGFGQIEEDSFKEPKRLPAFADIDLRLGWVYDSTASAS